MTLSRYLRKRMTCSPLIALRRDCRCSRIRRWPAVRHSAPIRFNRSLCSMLVRSVGVCPRGAHVRLSGETSEKPVSSRKTRVALSCCHFFYLRPEVTLPMRNGFIIAVQRLALGLLTTPPQSLQQTPHAGRLVPYPKQVPDQMRDAVQRPVIFWIALPVGTLLQGLKQAPALGGRQASRTSRWTLLPAGWPHRVLPSPDTALTGADPFRHLSGSLSAPQPAECPLTPLG